MYLSVPYKDYAISIHALREEGDCSLLSTLCATIRFLSTPSARRATSTCSGVTASFWISIHALREEGDGFRGRELLLLPNFYPRPPRGGRLKHCCV